LLDALGPVGTELDDGESTDDLVAAAGALGSSPSNSAPAEHERGRSGADARPHRDAGLRVACVSTGSELYRNGGSIADRALLLEAIELAAEARAPFVNTYFGYARCATTTGQSKRIGNYSARASGPRPPLE